MKITTLIFLWLLVLLAGCVTHPAEPPLPPALPIPSAQALAIQPITIWTAPILTLLWDGCSLTNAVDTVNESDSIPLSWTSIFQMPCTAGQMSFQITADKPMAFFQIKRSAAQ